jgi:isochorismate synthase
VVGYFQKNDHFFAENFEESGFIFCSFEGSQMILIPLISQVKWSALITSGEETPDSDLLN